jgi:hypothetical protein
MAVRGSAEYVDQNMPNRKQQRKTNRRNGPQNYLARTSTSHLKPPLETISSTGLVSRRILSYVTQALSSPTDNHLAIPYNMALVDAATTTALTNVFDQFRVMEVTVEWTPYFTQNTISSTGFIMGELLSVLDFDDTTALVALSNYYDYSTCQFGNTGSSMARRFVPTQNIVGQASVNMNVSKQWFNMTNFNMNHYGTKWCIAGQPNAPSPSVALGFFRISGLIELRQTR